MDELALAGALARDGGGSGDIDMADPPRSPASRLLQRGMHLWQTHGTSYLLPTTYRPQAQPLVGARLAGDLPETGSQTFLRRVSGTAYRQGLRRLRRRSRASALLRIGNAYMANTRHGVSAADNVSAAGTIYCRSALARDGGGSGDIDVTDPARSPASRLLQRGMHPWQANDTGYLLPTTYRQRAQPL
jgi:hypothetical protein